MDINLFEEEFIQLENALKRLRQDSNSKAVFLQDKNDQQISADGEIENLDSTSLSALTSNNIAGTDAVKRLIGEREFSMLLPEGENDHIHISIVGKCAFLVVIFDEKSSLGLVRSRVKTTTTELNGIFDVFKKKGSGLFDITDDDIKALFTD